MKNKIKTIQYLIITQSFFLMILKYNIIFISYNHIKIILKKKEWKNISVMMQKDETLSKMYMIFQCKKLFF